MAARRPAGASPSTEPATTTTKTTSCPAAHPSSPPKRPSTAPAVSTSTTPPPGTQTPDVSTERTTSVRGAGPPGRLNREKAPSSMRAGLSLVLGLLQPDEVNAGRVEDRRANLHGTHEDGAEAGFQGRP